MHGEPEFQRRLELIERAVRELEATSDAGLRATTQQLVQSIMELHGRGLDRLLTLVRGAGAAGDAMIDTLADDPLVGSLLVLYGLHPVDVRSRVSQGLDDARAALTPKGVSIELVSLDEETSALRLRLHGLRQGDGATPDLVRRAVDEAVRSAAPDIASLVIDDDTIAAPVGASPLMLVDHRGRPLHRSRDAHGQPAAPAVVETPTARGARGHVEERST